MLLHGLKIEWKYRMIKMMLPCLVAFCITLYAGYLLQPVAKHLGLIDAPGGRKQHDRETPLVGGIAMFLGFAFALLTLPISLADFRGLIAGSALLVIVGVLDDLHEIPHYARLVGQTAAGLCLIFFGSTALTSLGNLIGSGVIQLNYTAIPFTLFIVIATINAMNMLDGLDGLLGSISAIILAALFLISLNSLLLSTAYIIGIVLACTLGFLFYNYPWRKAIGAKMFMGDSGSMWLGYTLIWVIVDLSDQPTTLSINVAQILWLLAIPIFDIINVTLRRVLTGRNPLFASRDHIHHFCQAMGLNQRYSLFVIILCTAISNMVGLVGYFMQVAQPVLFYSFALLFVFTSLIYQLLWTKVAQLQS